jgi:hypothetical protein
MSEPPADLSPQNEAELATWPDLAPEQQPVMRRLWGDQPAASSEAA